MRRGPRTDRSLPGQGSVGEVLAHKVPRVTLMSLQFSPPSIVLLIAHPLEATLGERRLAQKSMWQP